MAGRTNPNDEVVADLAQELHDSRERAKKSNVMEFHKAAAPMADVRAKLESSTPDQRKAILEDMKQNKDYKTKMKQLLSHYRGEGR